MSAPRFYSWDDDGSIGRGLTGNLQNRLKQILVACLVTGYGDKPAAGWTLEHEHENGFTLSNGDGYVNFVSNLPANPPYPAMVQVIHIYCAESITDTSSAIIDGANLCSGSFRKDSPELNNFPRHTTGVVSGFLSTQLSTLNWVLVADDKTFTLNCSSVGALSNPGSYSSTLHVGAISLDNSITGNFGALGGDILNYSVSNASTYAFSRGYTFPRDLSTGLAQLTETGAEPYRGQHTVNPALIGEPPPRLNLQQPRLLADGVFVGRLRGVLYDDVLRFQYGWETHLKALGFSGDDFADRGKAVQIGDYRYAFARSQSGNSFLTDNPDFW